MDRTSRALILICIASFAVGGLLYMGHRRSLAGASICVFGSSTAAGVGASHPSRAWISRLVAATGDAIISFAVGGSTIVEFASEGEASLSVGKCSDVQTWVFHFPSNDLAKQFTQAELAAAHIQLRDICRKRKKKCIFVGLQPRNDVDGLNEKLAQANAELRSIHGEQYVDVFGLLEDGRHRLKREYDSGDGVHLNDTGHFLIAVAVREALVPE
jgi:acyl-CoA thioesterase I